MPSAVRAFSFPPQQHFPERLDLSAIPAFLHRYSIMRFLISLATSVLLVVACTPNRKSDLNDSTGTSAQWGKPTIQDSLIEPPKGIDGKPLRVPGRPSENPALVSPEVFQSITLQVKEMTEAHNRKDYVVFLKYSVVPGMSTNLTHRDKIIARLVKEDESMARQGIRIDSLVVMPVEHLASLSGSAYALIPKKMYISVSGKRTLTEGYLLGYSHDGGKQCFYIDLDNTSAADVYQLLPDVDGLFVWPGPPKRYQLP